MGHKDLDKMPEIFFYIYQSRTDYLQELTLLDARKLYTPVSAPSWEEEAVFGRVRGRWSLMAAWISIPNVFHRVEKNGMMNWIRFDDVCVFYKTIAIKNNVVANSQLWPIKEYEFLPERTFEWKRYVYVVVHGQKFENGSYPNILDGDFFIF